MPAPDSGARGIDAAAKRRRGLALFVALSLSLLFLNAALTFDNYWPTPAIVPSPAVSLEFIVLVGVLLLAGAAESPRRLRLVSLVAATFTLLASGRYAEVTLPALFGRPINLYWDGQHIPGLLALAWQQTPIWRSLAVVATMLALVVVVHRLVYLATACAMHALAAGGREVRRAAFLTTAGVGATAMAIALVPAVGALPASEKTHLRDYVVQPVSVTVLRQALFVAAALSPSHVARALPQGPSFTGDVEALRGADVILVFLESYGAAAFDNPAYSRALQPHRERLGEAVAAGGRQVVSGFVNSPTFGGGSWLAHASLLSGIDVTDPHHYDLLLTTRRPTLVSHFRAQGYGTVALMPGIRAAWPEGSFYGYDAILDSDGIDYRGPEFGYWRIPDQVSIARYAASRRVGNDARPQFLVFPTITSHIPFGPVPPYQADWSRLDAATPFSEGAVAQSLAYSPQWLNLGPAYVQTLAYSYDWLAGFLEQPAARDYLMIVVGDHQPAASVSGRGARWDVPVHVIAADPAMARRFVEAGFTPGVQPQGESLGPMSELTKLLLRILSAQQVAAR